MNIYKVEYSTVVFCGAMLSYISGSMCAVCFPGVKCGRDGSVDNHMEMGKKLLAAGQLADALSHFHAAVGKG